jgi:hypothetical protein
MLNNKVIKSKDGKIEVRYDEVTHVCIAPSLYPLLQYLLLLDDGIIFHQTCYFVNEVIPENVRKQLPCVYNNYFGKKFSQKVLRRLTKLRLRFFKYWDYPFLKSADIYALDIPYLSLCIGNRSYSSLSDAPNWLTLNMQKSSAEYLRQQKHSNSIIGKIQSLVFGNLFVHYLGDNQQCKAFYLTEENSSFILKGKDVHVQSLASLYSKATEKKKQFIMGLFDISRNEIEFLNSRPNLFFSQPLMNDCGLTEEEYVDVLTKIFHHYPSKSIIIKTHPRDNFDYTKHFPEMIVFSKPINSQLLCLMEITPQKIITVSSTAIEGFPETIECDYYGIIVHPKVEKYFGNNFKPKRKVNLIK